jgi:hypothetical protein
MLYEKWPIVAGYACDDQTFRFSHLSKISREAQ